MKSPELAVVMPVYNESGAIGLVINKWTEELRQLGVDWQIHLFDDGSTDNSLNLIKQAALQESRLIVYSHANQGHGPTVIGAYKKLLEAEWVFQVDSDNEVPAESFGDLWNKREQYDFLLGERVYGERPITRILVSFFSRVMVYGLFGLGVRDVNAPYRLMRMKAFKSLFETMPSDFFSPNLLITGLASVKKLRTYRVDIPYMFRQTGEVSIQKGKLLRAVVRSTWQTIYFRLFLMRKV